MTGEVAAVSDGKQAAPLSPRLTVVLLALGFVIFFFVLPHTVEGDGRLRFDALQSWLGGKGIPNTKYPLIGSLPAIPLLLIGRAVANPEWWTARFNVFVYAGGLGLLYRLLRGRVDGDVLAAFLLLMGTTAMLPNALTEFGAETFSALAVGAGLAAWDTGRWKTATVLLGLGVANLPASVIGLALALGWWAWRAKRLRAVLPVALGATLWMLDNLIRRGGMLVSGYENDHGFQTFLPYSGLPGFSYPTPFGVASLLASFGKGSLFFAPGLVLMFGRGFEALRELRPLLAMWLLFLAGLVLVYGSWWAWYGGFTWGPRFLLFASIPASLILAGQVRRPSRELLASTVVVVALTLSLWVGIDGQAFGRFAQSSCSANHYFLESFCWYVPEFSVLWTPFVFHASVSLPDLAIIVYAVAVTTVVAWPLIDQWTLSARHDASSTWAAYRNRAGWRF